MEHAAATPQKNDYAKNLIGDIAVLEKVYHTMKKNPFFLCNFILQFSRLFHSIIFAILQ